MNHKSRGKHAISTKEYKPKSLASKWDRVNPSILSLETRE
jgi:hypothetical protein